MPGRRPFPPALLFLILLSIPACGHRPLDESNLKAVAEHYYALGSPVDLPSDRAYRFLSAQSRSRLTPAEFADAFGGDPRNRVRAVEVLGERESGGRRYAIVSVTREASGPGRSRLRNVLSSTWRLESGKWRRELYPKACEAAWKACEAGEYPKARELARAWLALDPYAVEAWVVLAASGEVPPGDPSLLPGVRAMLAINPDDTEALYCAATCLASSPLSIRYLSRLEGTDRYLAAAMNLLAIFDYPEEMHDVMERIGCWNTAG